MTDRQSQQRSLYGRYRPETFADVRGQEHVVSVLEGSIASGDVGHAYLFAGSHGIGKTSIARIFARTLEVAPEDVYEIDGASHRKIEDIREIRDAVHTLPYRSTYKVYIIDEIHMLTREAFNALLKTLEEPPAHVIFMLATTELHKVPDTIISRCQTFHLRRPSANTVANLVSDVASSEKTTLTEAQSVAVAQAAGGSFRDALGVLQKVMHAAGGQQVTDEQVQLITGQASDQLVTELLAAIATKDTEGIFQTFGQIRTGASREGAVLRQVVETIRQLLRARFDTSYRKDVQKHVSETTGKFIQEYAGKEGAGLNAAALARCIKALRESRLGGGDWVMLELALWDILGHNSSA